MDRNYFLDREIIQKVQATEEQEENFKKFGSKFSIQGEEGSISGYRHGDSVLITNIKLKGDVKNGK